MRLSPSTHYGGAPSQPSTSDTASSSAVSNFHCAAWTKITGARHRQPVKAEVDPTYDLELAGVPQVGVQSRVRKRPNRNRTATASHPPRVKLRTVTREVAGHWGPTPLAVSDEVPSSEALHRFTGRRCVFSKSFAGLRLQRHPSVRRGRQQVGRRGKGHAHHRSQNVACLGETILQATSGSSRFLPRRHPASSIVWRSGVHILWPSVCGNGPSVTTTRCEPCHC